MFLAADNDFNILDADTLDSIFSSIPHPAIKKMKKNKLKK
jgi:hypothetical protein